jgi:hypothetical protein
MKFYDASAIGFWGYGGRKIIMKGWESQDEHYHSPFEGTIQVFSWKMMI